MSIQDLSIEELTRYRKLSNKIRKQNEKDNF